MISSSSNKTPLYTTPGTGPFAFSFKMFAASDLEVVVRRASGAEDVLTYLADYTVSLNADQESTPGGTYALTSAIVAGEKTMARRVVVATQGADIPNAGGWYPTVVEDALDRLTMLVQQVEEEVDRAVKVDLSSSSTPDQIMADMNAQTLAAAASASASAGSAGAAAASAGDAAASAVAAAASAVTAANNAAAVDFTQTSVSTFSNKTLDASCNIDALIAKRNFIVNGNFDISNQPIQSGGFFVLDRWYYSNPAEMYVDPSREYGHNHAGGEFSLRFRGGLSGGGAATASVDHILESCDVAALKGNTVTLACEIDHDAQTGSSVTISLHKNAAPNTRTGGAWFEIASQTITVGGVSTAKITAAVPNDSTAEGLMVRITWTGTTTPLASAWISGVRLVLGSADPGYVPKPAIEEEMACARFFQSLTFGAIGFTESTTVVGFPIRFPVPMRAAPGLTLSNIAFTGVLRHAGVAKTTAAMTLDGIVSTVNRYGAFIKTGGWTALTANLPVMWDTSSPSVLISAEFT